MPFWFSLGHFYFSVKKKCSIPQHVHFIFEVFLHHSKAQSSWGGKKRKKLTVFWPGCESPVVNSVEVGFKQTCKRNTQSSITKGTTLNDLDIWEVYQVPLLKTIGWTFPPIASTSQKLLCFKKTWNTACHHNVKAENPPGLDSQR